MKICALILNVVCNLWRRDRISHSRDFRTRQSSSSMILFYSPLAKTFPWPGLVVFQFSSLGVQL